MSHDILREHLSDIDTLRKELALRFALFSHIRQAHQVELMAQLHKINDELAEARELMKSSANLVTEERRFKRVRELEDQRFKLLSEINGDNFSQYTLETSLKDH